MIENFISVENLNVKYANNFLALDNINFRLSSHKICALVGINGSGKSTLFKTMMGFVKPVQGSVQIHDLKVHEALKKNLVAYVPQSEEVDWDFPIIVEEVVQMGRYGHMGFLRIPKATDHKEIQSALDRVGMTEFKHRQIGQLSGGQKKRVFLARALAQNAQIILLDEPFTGVDVKTENSIIDLLKELRNEGKLILVSTHNLGGVPDFCDEVILINRKLIAHGPVKTTFNQKNLSIAFGGMLRHIHLGGEVLHEDSDKRKVTVITDDERPLVFYGQDKNQEIIERKDEETKDSK